MHRAHRFAARFSPSLQEHRIRGVGSKGSRGVALQADAKSASTHGVATEGCAFTCCAPRSFHSTGGSASSAAAARRAPVAAIHCRRHVPNRVHHRAGRHVIRHISGRRGERAAGPGERALDLGAGRRGCRKARDRALGDIFIPCFTLRRNTHRCGLGVSRGRRQGLRVAWAQHPAAVCTGRSISGGRRSWDLGGSVARRSDAGGCLYSGQERRWYD
mmetsp:Transcript_37199/g.71338  ORF Transcript_37199/g.71338 Transcript_37199/m.71338 type:complete len:216 (+) Transcript_37199:432-1079(+)